MGQRIIRYLRAKPKVLVYKPHKYTHSNHKPATTDDKPFFVEAETDSDFAADKDRKSISGGNIRLNGNVVQAWSKKQ